MGHTRFFGKTVLICTFILAIVGWGVGFYGPPIYMQAVMERTGWPVAQVSAAVTLHFLSGTLVIANLPRLYTRFGVPAITLLGSVILGIGINVWAQANQLWMLYAGAICSGFGWVTLGATAVNTLIAPWYIKERPKALGKAYNGASLGGVIFSPLWVLLIERFGFATAALMITVVAVVLIGSFAFLVFNKSPQSQRQHPDNADQPEPAVANASTAPWSTVQTLKSGNFRTLAAGMSLGLFAQIGLIAHLYSILTGRMGAHNASFAMGLATRQCHGRALRRRTPDDPRRRPPSIGLPGLRRPDAGNPNAPRPEHPPGDGLAGGGTDRLGHWQCHLVTAADRADRVQP